MSGGRLPAVASERVDEVADGAADAALLALALTACQTALMAARTMVTNRIAAI